MISGHVKILDWNTCLVTSASCHFPSQRMHPERQGEAMWGLVGFCEKSF